LEESATVERGLFGIGDNVDSGAVEGEAELGLLGWGGWGIWKRGSMGEGKRAMEKKELTGALDSATRWGTKNQKDRL